MDHSPASIPAFDLARRLRAGATVHAGWVGLPDPTFVEQVARSPLEAVVLDMQHGLLDPVTVTTTVAAVVAAGRPAVVRVPVGDFAMASRALDMGAAGVIAPMIDSVADARAFADFVKFPPVGRRSWGPGRAMMLSGESDPGRYLATANAGTLALAMIETAEALAALDDILAVEGIDGVFVGPNDLSIALARGASVDPDGPAITAALERVAARAAAAGKVAGIFGGAPARVRALRAMGFRFLSIGHDTAYVQAGLRAMTEAAGV